MPALNASVALPALADGDVELPGDRLVRTLDLILVIDVGFVDGTAAVGAARRQRRFEELIDCWGGGRWALVP
jgi:hypothetical protein